MPSIHGSSIPPAIAELSTPITHSIDPRFNISPPAGQVSPKRLISQAIQNRIARLGDEPCQLGEDDPFFIADLGQVYRQHRRWKETLPQVQPFYAVKCNPDPTLLKYLAALGTGFDCASAEELRLVLSLGVDPSRMVFASPCKYPSAMALASKSGVRKMTFDNREELHKIRCFCPDAQLLLRIFASDESALIAFGDKFGAPISSTQALLERAWELGLNVVGVSFHIGTGANNLHCFQTAVQHAKTVFRQAAEVGFHLNTLDIGGGFQDSNFSMMAKVLRESIKLEFSANICVIAEPGRFFARSAYTLACKVISRRENTMEGSLQIPDMLYQNDGVYGNFMNVLIEKEKPVPQLITGHASICKRGEDHKSGGRPYSVWGPTCDSTDCITKSALFDSEVEIGDWLMYENMGAYTLATSTQFNGFTNLHDIMYVFSEPGCL